MDKLHIITDDVAANKSSSHRTIEQALSTTHISLAHGNGGRYMRQLITDLFLHHLGNQYLDTQADAVTVPVNSRDIVVTTDGFTVQPLEYPGGNIGSLAVHGTINDLAVAGATPLYLTINTFIEEGFEIATLDRIIQSMARAAQKADIFIVAGDTKVVRRGEGSGLDRARGHPPGLR